MAQIDSLDIKITAESQSAQRALTSLRKNLEKVDTTLISLNNTVSSFNLAHIFDGVDLTNVSAHFKLLAENIKIVREEYVKTSKEVSKSYTKASKTLESMTTALVPFNTSKTLSEIEVINSAIDSVNTHLVTVGTTALDIYGKFNNFYQKLEYIKQSFRGNKGIPLLEDRGRLLDPSEYRDIPNYNDLTNQTPQLEGTVNSLQAIVDTEKEIKKNSDFSVLVQSLNILQDISERTNKALKQFFSTIFNVSLAFGKLVSSMIDVRGAISFVQNKFNKFTSALVRGYRMLRLMILRTALRSVIKGWQQSLGDLAHYSDSFNESMSTMMASSHQLSNALGAMVSPIINAVAPSFVYLISLVTQAINVLNQFFSALTGNSTWIKATNLVEDYAKSTEKASKSAKNNLLKIDELNINNPSNSGSGTETDPNKMFSTENIDSNIKEYVDKVKKALEDNDLTNIGFDMGQKFSDLLSHINWDKIKSASEKIAEDLATLLNGCIYGTNWNTIGSTIAQGLNTALIFTNTLLENIDFKALGDAIGIAVNKAVSEFEWNLLGTTLANKINAIIDVGGAFAKRLEWKRLGRSIAKTFNTFIKKVKWEEMGVAFNDFCKGILDGISKAIKNFDFSKLGQSLGTALSQIDWKGNINKSLGIIKDAISGFFDFLNGLNANTGGVVVSVLEGIGTSLMIFGGLGTALTTFGSFTIQLAKFSESLKLLQGASGAVGLIGTIASHFGAILAVGGAVAVISGVAVGVGAYIEAVKNKSEIENFGSTLKDVSDQFKNIKDNCYDAIQEARNYVDSSDAQVGEIKILADKYFELAEKQGKTRQEYELMNQYRQELIDRNPSFAKILDDNTLSYDKQKDAIYENIEALKQKLFIEATQESAKDLIAQQVKEQANYNEKLDECKAIEEKINELKTNRKSLNQELQKINESDDPQAYQEVLDKLLSIDAEIRSLEKDFDTIAKSRDEAEQALNDVTKEYENMFGAMIEAQHKLKEFAEESGNVTKTVATVMAEHADECKDVAEEIGTEVGDTLADSIYKGSGSQTVPDRASELGKETVEKFNEGVSENVNPEVFANSFEGMKTGIETSWNNTMTWWKDTAIPEWNATLRENFSAESWQTSSQGMTDGIIAQFDLFKKKWDEKFKVWWEAINKNFSISVWSKFGKNMHEGLYGGFKSIVSNVGVLVNAIIDVFNEAFTNLEKSMNKLIDSYNRNAQIMGTSTLGNVSYSKVEHAKIPTFATGGFPEDGLFFANHNELVGQFSNGRTVVANNEQIIEGIRRGVSDANAETNSLLRIIADGISNGNHISIEIDGRELVKAYDSRKARNGFAF